MGLLGYITPSKKSVKETKEPAEPSEKAPEYNRNPVVNPRPSDPNTAVNTPRVSRPTSLYPDGDFRNAGIDEMNEMRCDVMVNYLQQQQLELMWTAGSLSEGVVLKRGRGDFTCCPPDLAQVPNDLYECIKKLNVRCAITVNTRVIKLFLRRTNMAYVPLKQGLHLQILPTVSHIPSCQKHHFAAFIQDTSLLVVWDDDPRLILDRARNLEDQLMKMLWDEEVDEKRDDCVKATVREVDSDGQDLEYDIEAVTKPRKLVLTQAILCGLTLMLLTSAIGSGWRNIVQEIFIDGSMIRIGFAAIVPLQVWLALFFMQSVVGCLAQIIGPTHQVKENTKFYSGERPQRIHHTLPHVTIQAPVYREGLENVIRPTIFSLKDAISTYEMQGGSANIFVNEDGMQTLPEAEQQQRKDFYEEHNIGWVARPKHNAVLESGEKFVRAGKFKKASNMNYCLQVTARVEEKLRTIDRGTSWGNEKENAAYRTALAEVIEEDEGRTWAEGNIRMGDYILIVDSDTRVPKDCFLDAVSEMEQSPNVAIIQYTSGVVNVTTSFFENGITFFTNLIYTAIGYAVAAGDVAPFVGHNAVLRWSALQDVSIEDPGQPEKFWSEETVSEDFDMALRLQTAGYVVRFASYTGRQGFQEGVSLTVYDELARWEKYAYGCSELIFHPLRHWFTKGPFTKLFRRFMTSSMPLPSKLTIMAYIGTYYAIASAWILTLANYFIVGWFNGYLDHYYIDSFKIFFSIIAVFTALGNVALAVLRYRTEDRSLIGSLVENFKWVPLLAVFLGGVSLHVSQAICSHLVGVNMEWGSTAKEIDRLGFFLESVRVMQRFRGTFCFCLAMAGLMVAGACFVPALWRIDAFIAIFPLSNVVVSHFLLPIALNPGLMLFSW